MVYCLLPMPLKTQRIVMWVLIGLSGMLSLFYYVKNLPPPNGKYDAFAKCIANTSTTLYGAFWCPHCIEQKNEFGSAAQYLPYVECSLPNTSETEECTAQGVKEYPTWQFPDGSRATGKQSFETLSGKTGCPLPTSTL
jgi:hypothetical protein